MCECGGREGNVCFHHSDKAKSWIPQLLGVAVYFAGLAEIRLDTSPTTKTHCWSLLFTRSHYVETVPRKYAAAGMGHHQASNVHGSKKGPQKIPAMLSLPVRDFLQKHLEI